MASSSSTTRMRALGINRQLLVRTSYYSVNVNARLRNYLFFLGRKRRMCPAFPCWSSAAHPNARAALSPCAEEALRLAQQGLLAVYFSEASAIFVLLLTLILLFRSYRERYFAAWIFGWLIYFAYSLFALLNYWQPRPLWL